MLCEYLKFEVPKVPKVKITNKARLPAVLQPRRDRVSTGAHCRGRSRQAGEA